MNEECKTILVFYVGVQDMKSSEVIDYVNQIRGLIHTEDANLVQYLVPEKEGNDIRIECINPQLVGPEGYKSVTGMLERLEKALTEFRSEEKRPDSTIEEIVLSTEEVRRLFLGISHLHKTWGDGTWVRMAEVLDGMACGLKQSDADLYRFETPYQLLKSLLDEHYGKGTHAVLEKFIGFHVRFISDNTSAEEDVLLQLLSPNKVLTTLKQLPHPIYGFKPSRWEIVGVHH